MFESIMHHTHLPAVAKSNKQAKEIIFDTTTPESEKVNISKGSLGHKFNAQNEGVLFVRCVCEELQQRGGKAFLFPSFFKFFCKKVISSSSLIDVVNIF